ncbi:acyl-CoA dehydrogenase family protein [Sphingoaurantiacus capsulatus]|uniref:Acyl-CoA dehydrogenase family protein n=1 Tax=Sphingoaurantiacus capsulatus TaxID=1771310 RepID=A0ABV7X5G7_9SPHN
MNQLARHDTDVATPQTPGSDERRMLLDAVRSFLEDKWPALKAVELGSDEGAVRRIGAELAGMGLSALGADRSMGGVQEILLVHEELGRAACPAPFFATSMINLLLAGRADALLDSIAAGTEFPALSFGPEDGDRTAGTLVENGDTVSGELRYLDAAAGITTLVAAVSPTRFAIVRLGDGAELIPTRSVGAAGLATLRLTNAAASFIDLPAGRLATVALVARLALAARAYGAAQRAFEMVVDYSKERKQFGRPIGGFQAIQHKFANSYIALEGVKQAIDGAGAQHDAGDPEWHVLATAAIAFASSSLRQVALETHHAFGAIGYAEEHEAPRHFKRVHQDVLRMGGVGRARAELAARFLDEGRGFPDFNLGAEANAFRGEVRAWLAEHWPASRRDEWEARNRPHHHDRDFNREFGTTGWLALNWPRKFGGMDGTPMELLALHQELVRAEAPRVGSQIQAVGWMLYGRPEQQAEYLPALARGEAFYGMWYSEPGSGSDLASLQTRAVRDGDHYVINGQKIWTTSFYGDYMWLAARTDPTARPDPAGITMFCVPTSTPGYTISRMDNMYDGEFAQTFFDDMRVPAECVVGEENKGWRVLMGALGTERGIAGATIVMEAANLFEHACAAIRADPALRQDATVRDTIGWLAAELAVGRQLGLYCFEVAGTGETPLQLAAATKVFSSELTERMSEGLQEVFGMEASLSRGAEGALLHGKLEQKLRNSLMYVISMGTNEIQRNIIAQRGLGLPRP